MSKPERNEKGHFIIGKKGGPGRPKGSRSKLATEFIDALYQDFEQHGVGVIAKVRSDKPDVYLKVVANLMPAKMEASLTQVSLFASYDLQDPKEFLEAYRIAKSMIGADPPAIELEAERRDAEFSDDD
ncbi:MULTISPECIES: hypothetical protein [Bradyrhizobium]|nr:MULTISPECIES: hypothetical protein [Bradyrhizobium]